MVRALLQCRSMRSASVLSPRSARKLSNGPAMESPPASIKFGKKGKIARVNQAKGTVFISVGIGQWEVFLNDVLPDEPKQI